jgi:hypothetical protein
VYARATFSGSREFQPSSARRTFCMAVSRVNGGNGGRVDMIFSFLNCFGNQTANSRMVLCFLADPAADT